MTPRWLPDCNGAGGQLWPTETTIGARRVFQLASRPASASILAGFDDDADVRVNRRLVISEHNRIANNVGVADLLPHLKVGDNLIAVATSWRGQRRVLSSRAAACRAGRGAGRLAGAGAHGPGTIGVHGPDPPGPHIPP